jgi:branched-chain amino acid aminotransferase
MTEHRSSHDAAHDPRNDSILIWVNGKLVPRDQAVVSVYDSGFMMGDGIWEGLRLYNGRWAVRGRQGHRSGHRHEP